MTTDAGMHWSLPEPLQAEVSRIHQLSEEAWTGAIDALCARHPDHAEVLRGWLRVVRALDRPSATPANGRPSPEVAPPQHIGPYRILERLGSGGMGVVYKAEQEAPVRRIVALKLIKLGMDSEEILARFELERHALAAMNHSAIGVVFDAGTTERGQPWFVMELVDGLPLTEYCDRHRLSIRDRIELFQRVCAGVQHAHQKGVVHRDLKPGNIMVVRDGDRAVPKILDFGLAKATDRDLMARSFHTERVGILGTLEYMAPEQAAFDDAAIDTRADIYSLGVILYELTSGTLPFSSDELRKASWIEIQRKLGEDEPSKPSTRLSSGKGSATEFARKCRTTLHALARELRGDLDWIALKALAKEPERRYDSATALAADLQRHLDHLPVSAGPPSAAYRLSKLLRRYRVQVMAGAVVFLTLVGGVISSTWLALESRDNLSRFRMVANVVQLARAEADAQHLYPAWPDRVAGMRTWLHERGEALAGQLPGVEVALRELAVRVDRAAGATDQLDEFMHATLSKLVADLRGFTDPKTGELASVRERLAWAERIADLTLHHPGATATWDEASAAVRKADGVVASALYGRDRSRSHPIELQPQWGLVPIGMNPATKLWEFYHLRSAWDPESGTDPAAIRIPGVPDYDEAGRLPVDGQTGIVFVLIPGGTDRLGEAGFQSPHDETLTPFFLARHELTQGQWRRLARGPDPSVFGVGVRYEGMTAAVTLAHPVENATWEACDETLGRQGLRLPSEAEWEYACRAGTDTPWHSGSTPQSLAGFANILDRTSQDAWPGEVFFSDGFLIHAPVGSLRPNGFGLFDMHGNVWEWCADLFEGSSHAHRGGSFNFAADFARSAYRDPTTPRIRENFIGVRPARELLGGHAQ